MIRAATSRGLVVAWLIAIAPFAGCLKPDAVTCAGGLICPADSTCDDANHTCKTSNSCGDGQITGLEVCDGAPPPGKTCLDYGYERGLLGCSATCTPDFTGCGYLAWQTAWSGSQGAAGNSGAAASSGAAGAAAGSSGAAGSPAPADGQGAIVEPIEARLNGIWGSGPNDIFAVGSGAVVHWDGHVWSANTQLGAQSVWGSGPDDVVAVGWWDYSGTIFQWNGRSWTRVALPAIDLLYKGLYGVWGSGPDDVWVVGDAGTILHRTGSVWQSIASGTTVTLRAIWGASPNDAYAVGDGGTIVHWDGDHWTATTTGAPDLPKLSSVWGSGPNDVYLAGSDGRGGLLLHGDGDAWNVIPTGPTAELRSVWGTGADDVFVVGGGSDGGVALHWDGTTWDQTLTHQAAPPLSNVWGSGPDDVFAAAGNEIIHWPGTTVSTTDGGGLFTDVRGGDGFDDVFAVALGKVAHWDGKAWTVEDAPIANESRIWPASPTDLFVLATAGTDATAATVFRKNGATWTRIGNVPGARVIWGAAADDVFVAGDGGMIVHWNGGGTWESMASGTTANLQGLWGSGPADVFAVGSDGTVVRWNGSAWQRVRSKAGENLRDVWGSSPTDVFVAIGDDVGESSGGLIHWNGTTWTDLSQAVSARAVGGSGPGDVFVCADQLLRHSYLGAWETLPQTSLWCGRVYVKGAQVFVVGWGATVLDRRSVTCSGPERLCSDGWDNDCDGLADGADPDCKGLVAEQCANGADDDGDGKIDCADPDCAGFPCKR